MAHDPLTLALIGLVLALQILWRVLDKRKNGHISEDRLRLIVSEELRGTRHDLRNTIQESFAEVRNEIRNLR